MAAPCLYVERTTANSVTVAWTPLHQHRSDIIEYEIKYETPDGSEELITTGCPMSQITVEDLQENSSYKFRVHVVGLEGNGPYSDAVCVQTTHVYPSSNAYQQQPIEPATYVQPFAQHDATDIGDNEDNIMEKPGRPRLNTDTSRLVWNNPVAHKNIVGYNIHYRQKGKTTWHMAKIVTDDFGFKGLPAGMVYEFRVQALFQGREGALSGISGSIQIPDVESSHPRRNAVKSEKETNATRNELHKYDGKNIQKYSRNVIDHPNINVRKLNMTEIPLPPSLTIDVKSYETGYPGAYGSSSQTTILFIGLAKSGKTTLINGLLNCIFNIEWNGNYRLTLSDNSLGNHHIPDAQVYTIRPEAGRNNLTHDLVLIDTPKLSFISEDMNSIEYIMEHPESVGVKQIDIVCTVQTDGTPLTTPQKLALSRWTTDSLPHVSFCTFSLDYTPREASSMYNSNEIYCVNNSALYAQVDTSESIMSIHWENSQSSYKQFLSNIAQNKYYRHNISEADFQNTIEGQITECITDLENKKHPEDDELDISLHIFKLIERYLNTNLKCAGGKGKTVVGYLESLKKTAYGRRMHIITRMILLRQQMEKHRQQNKDEHQIIATLRTWGKYIGSKLGLNPTS